MEMKRTESKLGRFSYLLKGRARPRRSLALMMALVIIAVLSFAGVVSADNYQEGTVPETVWYGCVNGSVDVQFVDTWNKTPVTDWSKQESWANFTLNLPAGATVKYANLVVVDYLGSMTADYYGNMTVKMYKDDTYNTTLVAGQALDLKYVNTTGANYSVVSLPLVNLSRVSSDYVANFNVTCPLASWNYANVNVSLTSYNLTGKFDGRFKEAKLVYAYNVPAESSTGWTCFWVNLGHDPVTKYDPTYTGTTWFRWFCGATPPASYNATLWVDYLATPGGEGVYKWNGNSLTGTSTTQGVYAGLNKWTWDQSSGPGLNFNSPYDNALNYGKSRSSSWYKIVMAVFALKNCTCCPCESCPSYETC